MYSLELIASIFEENGELGIRVYEAQQLTVVASQPDGNPSLYLQPDWDPSEGDTEPDFAMYEF